MSLFYLLGLAWGLVNGSTDGNSTYLWLLGKLGTKANLESYWFLGVAAISVKGVFGKDVISLSILATPPLILSLLYPFYDLASFGEKGKSICKIGSINMRKTNTYII